MRCATDYFLKVTAKPNTVYVQVGDAFKDHSCWERPEDMDTLPAPCTRWTRPTRAPTSPPRPRHGRKKHR